MIRDWGRRLLELRERVIAGQPVTADEAVELLELAGPDVIDLFAAANRVREHFKGIRVLLCAIVNARSGNCPEDCGFCAQSVHNRAEVNTFPMIPVDEIVDAARQAQAAGAACLGIVTSGRTVTGGDLDRICEAVRRIRAELSILPDASLGILDGTMAEKLKAAGLNGYHHNVETARSYYPSVCTTHSYEENLETLRTAKSFGFKVCSGGIFGLGEDRGRRVEMLDALRDEDVDRVCLNFYMPVPGTRFGNAKPLEPVEILKTIAVARLMLPDKDINICAGREMHLRDLQGMIFYAGASATMIGNYLTQKGRSPEDDLRLLSDAGLARRQSDG